MSRHVTSCLNGDLVFVSHVMDDLHSAVCDWSAGSVCHRRFSGYSSVQSLGLKSAKKQNKTKQNKTLLIHQVLVVNM